VLAVRVEHGEALRGRTAEGWTTKLGLTYRRMDHFYDMDVAYYDLDRE